MLIQTLRSLLNTRLQVRSILTSSCDVIISPNFQALKETSNKVDRTVLDGGVQVLSVENYHPITTLSVFVKAGSRYETTHTTSATTFLKHLGYKGTHEKSALRLIRDVEHIGASYHTAVTRDTVSYNISGIRYPEESQSVNLDIMAETIRFGLNPLLLEYEIENVRPIVEHEIEVSEEPRLKVIELLHAEAFRDSGLGQPLAPTHYGAEMIDGQRLHTHVKNFYYPGERMTIVGTGIEHSQLLNKISPLFSNATLKGKYHELRGLDPIPLELIPQTPNFVGGTIRITSNKDTHVAIGFPGFSMSHRDQLALTVLSEILGGGSINYTGPVRKGSKIYQRVVGNNNWIHSADTFNFAYSDCGLFGIYAHARSGHGGEVVNSILEALKSVNSISEEDVQHGIQAAYNKFLLNTTVDKFFLASYIASTGSSTSDYLSSLLKVTLDDVQRVAKSVTGANPALAAYGDVRGIPKL